MNDIKITDVVFDGDVQNTTFKLFERINDFISKLNIDPKWYGHIEYIELSRKTNKFDKLCVAYMSFQNTRVHQDFVERFNNRIVFRDRKITLLMSEQQPNRENKEQERERERRKNKFEPDQIQLESGPNQKMTYIWSQNR